MVVFNITINVDEQIEKDFLLFVKETWMPLLANETLFSDARICKVLVEEEMGGKTFSLQLSASSLSELETFEKNKFPIVYQVLHEKFMNKFVIFTTKMEFIHQINA